MIDFGYTFFYWEEYKVDAKKFQIPANDYNLGEYFERKLYINSNFENCKQEIL